MILPKLQVPRTSFYFFLFIFLLLTIWRKNRIFLFFCFFFSYLNRIWLYLKIRYKNPLSKVIEKYFSLFVFELLNLVPFRWIYLIKLWLINYTYIYLLIMIIVSPDVLWFLYTYIDVCTYVEIVGSFAASFWGDKGGCLHPLRKYEIYA